MPALLSELIMRRAPPAATEGFVGWQRVHCTGSCLPKLPAPLTMVPPAGVFSSVIFCFCSHLHLSICSLIHADWHRGGANFVPLIARLSAVRLPIFFCLSWGWLISVVLTFFCKLTDICPPHSGIRCMSHLFLASDPVLIWLAHLKVLGHRRHATLALQRHWWHQSAADLWHARWMSCCSIVLSHSVTSLGSG